MKTLIIAEAGVNHNGDINLAYELIVKAKEAGADIVKFQTFKTEKIISKNTDMAQYQKENLNSNESQFDMIKKLELSFEDFKLLKEYSDKIGITFLSTPDDEDSLDFLVNELNIPYIKISSGDITNFIYLEKIAKKNRPIILSTGMSNLGEIEKAIELIRKYSNKELWILHCTTNYPCPFDEVNLRAMNTIKTAFNVKVGYSDHTLGLEVPIAAVTMGAEIIEKHFTLDNNMEGPDHKASLNPIELEKMILCIRNIEMALGDGVKKPTKSEEKIKIVGRKRIVASRDLRGGEVINREDISMKRANEGIYSEHYEMVIGRKLLHNLKEDSPILLNNLKENN